jgi:tetratricopeptide (TPR) repeat protein
VLDEENRASQFSHGIVAELETALNALSGSYVLQSGPTGDEVRSGYLIDGSIRGQFPTRLHARVTSLADKTVLWSGQFTIAHAESFAEQENVARKIVEAVQHSLSDGNWANFWADVPLSSEAWASFQKGRVQEHFARRSAWSRAIDHYRRALRVAPEFVQAKISLGFCLLDGVRLCWEPSEDAAIATAQQLAEEVLASSPQHPLALALTAFIDAARGDFNQALLKMTEVVTRTEESPELTAYLGAIHGYAGNLEREIDLCVRALRLTPHPPVWIWTNLALARLMTGESDVGAELETILATDPDNVRGLIARTIVEVRQERTSEAHETAKAILAVDPAFVARNWRNIRFFKDKSQHERLALDLAEAGL